MRRGATVLFWGLVISAFSSVDAAQEGPREPTREHTFQGLLLTEASRAFTGIYDYLKSRPWSDFARQHENMFELYKWFEANKGDGPSAETFVTLADDTYKAEGNMIAEDVAYGAGYKRWTGLDQVDDETYNGILKVSKGRVYEKKGRKRESDSWSDHPVMSIWKKDEGERQIIFSLSEEPKQEAISWCPICRLQETVG